MWSTQKGRRRRGGESKFKVFNVLKIVPCNLLFTECTVVIGFVSLLRVCVCVCVDMEKFNNGALMSCRCRSHYQTSLRKRFRGLKCSRNHKAARLCSKLSAAPLMSYQVCLPLTADRQHLCDTTN